MGNSITLQDVAKLAGVSIGTASQALNNRPSVAQETRACVLDAAKMLGYPIKREVFDEPPPTIKIIGLLTKHDIGLPVEINPFYSHIQAGIESECSKRRISLMYANVEVDVSNHPVAWPSMIEEQHIDGLILAGTFIEETVDFFQRRTDVPIVLVDSYAPHLPFDSVVIDNIAASRAAIEYLIEQGHTAISLYGWNKHAPPSIQERKMGYCQALCKHGLNHTYVHPSSLSREDGPSNLQALLNDHPEVTAIFACNDLVALELLASARELGLRVPQDLSIMGFDNIDLAKEVTPTLSTVHVYKTWLGALSVRQLLARAESPEHPKLTIALSTRLVIRESSGAPRHENDQG